VTGDHGGGGGCGRRGEVVQIMQKEDGVGAKIDRDGLGQCFRPCARVVVAAHGRHGGERAKRFEDLGGADVAGVQDLVDAAQRGEGLRSN
jgi:hypothetical protein